jgi:hypothetical protein
MYRLPVFADSGYRDEIAAVFCQIEMKSERIVGAGQMIADV